MPGPDRGIPLYHARPPRAAEKPHRKPATPARPFFACGCASDRPHAPIILLLILKNEHATNGDEESFAARSLRHHRRAVRHQERALNSPGGHRELTAPSEFRAPCSQAPSPGALTASLVKNFAGHRVQRRNRIQLAETRRTSISMGGGGPGVGPPRDAFEERPAGLQAKSR